MMRFASFAASKRFSPSEPRMRRSSSILPKSPSAKSDKEALQLLSELGLPFKRRSNEVIIEKTESKVVSNKPTSSEEAPADEEAPVSEEAPAVEQAPVPEEAKQEEESESENDNKKE